MSQTEQILNHLLTRPITPLDALKEYGCMRLAPRIMELRDEGLDISTTIIKNGKKRYAEYKMVGA